jgi:hypothetical protein
MMYKANKNLNKKRGTLFYTLRTIIQANNYLSYKKKFQKNSSKTRLNKINSR